MSPNRALHLLTFSHLLIDNNSSCCCVVLFTASRLPCGVNQRLLSIFKFPIKKGGNKQISLSIQPLSASTPPSESFALSIHPPPQHRNSSRPPEPSCSIALKSQRLPQSRGRRCRSAAVTWTTMPQLRTAAWSAVTNCGWSFIPASFPLHFAAQLRSPSSSPAAPWRASGCRIIGHFHVLRLRRKRPSEVGKNSQKVSTLTYLPHNAASEDTVK